jgi:hypothetical protein
MPITEPVSIRRAAPADLPVLQRLASLDSAPVPAGDVLIASAGGEDRAAIAVATGAVVADPFRPTSDLVALLTLRAGSLRGPAARRRWVSLRRRSVVAVG